MKAKRKRLARNLNAPMAALMDNLQEVAAQWGIKPYVLLARAGLTPGLWYQWEEGQQAGTGSLEPLAELIGIPHWDLIRPDAVKEAGVIANPFDLLRASKSASSSPRLKRAKSAASSKAAGLQVFSILLTSTSDEDGLDRAA